MVHSQTYLKKYPLTRARQRPGGAAGGGARHICPKFISKWTIFGLILFSKSPLGQFLKISLNVVNQVVVIVVVSATFPPYLGFLWIPQANDNVNLFTQKEKRKKTKNEKRTGEAGRPRASRRIRNWKRPGLQRSASQLGTQASRLKHPQPSQRNSTREKH